MESWSSRCCRSADSRSIANSNSTEKIAPRAAAWHCRIASPPEFEFPLDPPSPAALSVGRHTGEDPGPRAPETLAYIVMEARGGRIEGMAYEAGLSADVVRGVEDAPPYLAPLSAFFSTVTRTVSSS